MNKNVLVTGGAGYIGSHVCKTLAIAGYTPVAFDNLTTGHKESVKWGPLEVGDVRDADRLSHVLGEHSPVGVMHLAGLAYVADSVVRPLDYYDVNVGGSLSLLRSLPSRSLPPVVFSSSCTVYAPSDSPVHSTSPIGPIAPYGETKRAVENMLIAAERAQGLKWMALRFFNAAGADPDGDIGETHNPEPHLIPNALKAAYGDLDTLIVHGSDFPTDDGTCIRDYIHVVDLASAHVKALQRLQNGSSPCAVNLGCGTGFSVLDIARRIEKITGRSVPLTIGPRRPGDAPFAVADTGNSVVDWDFSPTYSMDDIIETADRWYRRNRITK